MFLDATTKSIQLILAGAVTTNQAVVSTDWADNTATTFTAGSTDILSNGATAVTIVAAPAASTQRIVKEVSVYNADTAQMTVTVRLNNSGTFRTIVTVTLQTGERLAYSQTDGWRVSTVAGAIKVTAVQSTVEPGYIDGLIMRWNSGTSYTVTTGTAYIPSVGANVNLATDDVNAGLSLSANTWYHVYLFINSGVPDVEHVTTAPSTPYNGSARTKTGDTTRRYIGSFRTNASGNIFQFIHDSGNTVTYLYDSVATPARVLAGGTATTSTVVSLANVVPVTSMRAQLSARNDATNSAFLFTRSPDQPSSGGVVGPFLFLSVKFTSGAVAYHPVNSSQQIEYFFSAGPTPDGAYIDVLGYIYGR